MVESTVEEKAVLGPHAGSSQGVHQRGLPGVGVPHQRRQRDGGGRPGLALALPRAVDLLHAPLHMGDAAHDATPVGLQLGLPRTPGTDTPAQPAQLGALAPEPGKAVLEQGQLHLEHALPAGGMLGEDVEDDRNPVHHVALEQLLEVALLTGSEAVVEHHDVDIEQLRIARQVLRLARADEGGSMRRSSLQHHHAHRGRSGRIGQEPKLLQSTC